METETGAAKAFRTAMDQRVFDNFTGTEEVEEKTGECENWTAHIIERREFSTNSLENGTDPGTSPRQGWPGT